MKVNVCAQFSSEGLAVCVLTRGVVFVYPGEIRLAGQEHFYMETQSMLIVPVGEETEFNAYVSSQWPTLTQVRMF